MPRLNPSYEARCALNTSLHNFFIVRKCKVIWRSRNPDHTWVLAEEWEREGNWKTLSHIDMLRGTGYNDHTNYEWSQLWDGVPTFRVMDGNVSATDTKGNMVEAIVGASFLAMHEMEEQRFMFRVEPREAIGDLANIFSDFVRCGVAAPPLVPRDDWQGIPGALIAGSLQPIIPIRYIQPRAEVEMGIQAASAWETQAAAPFPAQTQAASASWQVLASQAPLPPQAVSASATFAPAITSQAGLVSASWALASEAPLPPRAVSASAARPPLPPTEPTPWAPLPPTQAAPAPRTQAPSQAVSAPASSTQAPSQAVSAPAAQAVSAPAASTETPSQAVSASEERIRAPVKQPASLWLQYDGDPRGPAPPPTACPGRREQHPEQSYDYVGKIEKKGWRNVHPYYMVEQGVCITPRFAKRAWSWGSRTTCSGQF